jgi:hypothetical protein
MICTALINVLWRSGVARFTRITRRPGSKVVPREPLRNINIHASQLIFLRKEPSLVRTEHICWRLA